MVLTKQTFVLLIFTASTFFLLGAFYQHDAVLRELRILIQTDPYAFRLRKKLIGVLKLFAVSDNALEINSAPTRMQEIMKYGFPGMDDIRTYSDFILSYDRRNRVAHWVYEHLSSTSAGEHLRANRRLARYQPDMEVPSIFRVDSIDYGRSGYDRGHLAAAGNHKREQTHCNETFYLTNIAPQVGKGFNQDAWNNLEIYVRNLAERYGSVYVCTGPLYKPKQLRSGKWYVEYEVIGQSMVAVPTHFFKVITVESKLPLGRPYMEAYVMPNEPIDNERDIRSFLTDIRDIERTSGLQFFDGLRRSFFVGTNYSTAREIYSHFE